MAFLLHKAVLVSAIYVQHTHNRSYYYGENRWTLGRERARRFADTREAITFCLDQGLAYAQVHVSFGPGAADVLIPVTRDMPVASAPTEAVVWYMSFETRGRFQR